MARQEVKLNKLVYGKVSYPNIIDTEFTQLVTPDTAEPVATPMTVAEFFTEYDRCVDRINYYWSRMPMFRWYDERTFWANEGFDYPPTYLTRI